MTKYTSALRHSWQEDPEMISVQLMVPRQRCGLACLEMVIEFALQRHIDATEIYHRATSYQAINKHNDWWHPGQVKVLASYGIVAWRRNWTVLKQDPSYFIEHEGYGSEQMAAVTSQIENESKVRTMSEAFVMSLRASLESNNPVIVSVKTDFSQNKENHQVVIAGYDSETQQYSVYDPVMPTGPAMIDESYLLAYTNYWAIFVQV
ncbi:MAG: C39 family peptidase [bacterium]